MRFQALIGKFVQKCFLLVVLKGELFAVLPERIWMNRVTNFFERILLVNLLAAT